MPELTFRRWILEKEKEKRYSYIRKKLARGTVGACILSGLALLLFLFCISYSFYRHGEAGMVIAAIALLSVHFSAFSLCYSFGEGKIFRKTTDISCDRIGYPSSVLLAVFLIFGNQRLILTKKNFFS